MSNRIKAPSGGEPAPVCGVGMQGLQRAVVSWLMPLVAVMAAGLSYPAGRAFNIVFAAFGPAALARSVAHIRQYGSCGLAGHVVIGVSLNAVIVALVTIEVFTGLDPFRIRP